MSILLQLKITKKFLNFMVVGNSEGKNLKRLLKERII